MKRFTRDDTEHGKEYYLASDVDAALVAQRTWVGLNGYQQKKLMAMTAREAVFATEAKLKELNT